MWYIHYLNKFLQKCYLIDLEKLKTAIQILISLKQSVL